MMNNSWEESMDKNFEYIARMVKEKQRRKDENLQKRYLLTEVLDDMDRTSETNQIMKRELMNLKEDNAYLENENKILEVEVNKYKSLIKKEKDERDAEKGHLKETYLIPLKFEVDRLQRELDELRNECVGTMNHQRYEEIEILESKIAEADQELAELQHESRNISIKMNKQSKRLKEKLMTINMMIQNQDDTKNSKGKIIMKEASKDSGLTTFYDRMRGIINSK